MATQQQRGRTNAIIGMVLVGLGAMFLLGQLFNINMWRFFWPFFIIIPGLLFFLGMALGGKSAGPLAIPGSIVTTVGLLLLYQSVTNHWESWAYAWALIFPTSVGVGLAINGAWSEVPRLRETGMKWIRVGLIIFVVGGVFFELLLNISHSVIGSVIWPLLLIGGGIYLLVSRRSRLAAPPTPASPAEPEAPPEKAEPEFEPLRTGKDK